MVETNQMDNCRFTWATLLILIWGSVFCTGGYYYSAFAVESNTASQAAMVAYQSNKTSGTKATHYTVPGTTAIIKQPTSLMCWAAVTAMMLS